MTEDSMEFFNVDEEALEKEAVQMCIRDRIERAQTRVRALWGSDRIIDSKVLAEWFWESQPERVKAP